MYDAQGMRRVDIREARKNFSALLDEVKAGGEVVITQRGRPVAKLVPPGFPNLAAFRATMPVFDPPLSTTLDEDREDRV